MDAHLVTNIYHIDQLMGGKRLTEDRSREQLLKMVPLH
jgi:hypothetical protein